MPKKFVGEPFCDVFQKNPGGEKLYGKEGGGSIKILCRKFLSHSAETMVGEPFCAVFQNLSGSRKNMDKTEGSIDILRRKFFVSQCRKNS